MSLYLCIREGLGYVRWAKEPKFHLLVAILGDVVVIMGFPEISTVQKLNF